MYKDKNKQREANKQAKARQRHKASIKTIVEDFVGMTNQGMTRGEPVIPKRGKYIDDQGNAHVPDQDFTRLIAQAGPGHVRVSKPGDADYEPQCETTRRFIDGNQCVTEKTTFGDLKDDVRNR